jgi:glycerol-3-phosphate dehydrogenase
MPAAGMSADDVAYSFAGLRALVPGDGGISPSTVAREEIVIESTSGLLSVAGGKLTTHREIAQKIVDELMYRVGRPAGGCPTLNTPLPGARSRNETAGREDSIVPADIRELLASRYGTRAALIAAIVCDRPAMAARLVPGCPAIRAEVVHAVRSELALSVSDFLVRRTSMVWRDPASAIAAAPEVARLMGAELGWDGERAQAEVEEFFTTQALRNNAASRDPKMREDSSTGGGDARTASR